MTINLGNGKSISVIGCSGNKRITSNLQEDEDTVNSEEALSIAKYNAAIDGMESLILACACKGIEVNSEEFIDCMKETNSNHLCSHILMIFKDCEDRYKLNEKIN